MAEFCCFGRAMGAGRHKNVYCDRGDKNNDYAEPDKYFLFHINAVILIYRKYTRYNVDFTKDNSV